MTGRWYRPLTIPYRRERGGYRQWRTWQFDWHPRRSSPSETTSAFRVDWRVVHLEVVIERGLVRLGQFLTVHLDVGCSADLLLGHLDLKIVRTDLNAAQRHERQVTTNEALFDGGELRLVVLDIDVDILQLADLLAVASR